MTGYCAPLETNSENAPLSLTAGKKMVLESCSCHLIASSFSTEKSKTWNPQDGSVFPLAKPSKTLLSIYIHLLLLLLKSVTDERSDASRRPEQGTIQGHLSAVCKGILEAMAEITQFWSSYKYLQCCSRSTSHWSPHLWQGKGECYHIARSHSCHSQLKNSHLRVSLSSNFQPPLQSMEREIGTYGGLFIPSQDSYLRRVGWIDAGGASIFRQGL